ncbi:MAG: serine/threonine-protein kinase [Candidatus Eremiobacteraeota bacterium]|nr:serine/threonine-protein kinase [Candidatus Eremiobacteraeota bacterium]
MGGKDISERLPKGTVINSRYEILRYVGEGGQKRVYEVKDLNGTITVPVVIKEMKKASTQEMNLVSMQLFEQESIILMKLSHPTFPKIYDFFVDQGTFYLIQEYIDGEDMDRALAKGIFSEEQALDYTMQLAAFLDYLHSNVPPIIFRDMKPGNVMIGKNGKLYIVDLSGALLPGIGKQAEAVIVKTAGYFPRDYQNACEATDIYAIGVTLYEMLTRHPIHKAGVKLPPLKNIRDGLSFETENLVNRLALYGKAFRLGKAWEAKMESEEALRSLKKYNRILQKEGFAASFSRFFHESHVKYLRPMGSLIFLLLIFGMFFIPHILHRFFNSTLLVNVIPAFFLYCFSAFALLMYMIWTRLFSSHPGLSRIYRLFHSKIAWFGGLRPITLLVAVNFFIISAVYISMLMLLLSVWK